MDLTATAIRSMEPAIVARLRLGFPANKFSLERVPSMLTAREFERVTRQTPFIGLSWMGISPDAASGRALQAKARWRVVLVCKASSGLEARFKGDKHDIGLDAMVDVAIVLLQGAPIAKVGWVTVTAAEAIYVEGWADDATVLAQVDFSIGYQASAGELRLVEPEDFARLQVDWFNAASPAAGAPELPQTINPPQDEAP